MIFRQTISVRGTALHSRHLDSDERASRDGVLIFLVAYPVSTDAIQPPRCRLKVYISLETDTLRCSYNTQFDQGILR